MCRLFLYRPPKMLDQLEADCRKLNMRWIISCITDSNEESIAFHKKHGFTMYGALPSCGMKFDAWHGVVWLCKRLDEVKKAFSCASNATILGNVSIGEGSSVWYNAVIRSEEETIEIGQESNIQDQCVLHTDRGYPLKIGDRVTMGHGAIVHGCTIEDEVLIGMGAIVLNGACIGSHSIIGAGCVVPENMVIPQRSVVVGVPAKIIKKTSESQVSDILSNADHYIKLSKKLD